MGTSYKRGGVRNETEDHPHAYGDKAILFCRRTTVIGSSPRVWGQGSFYSCRHSVRGIIPTRMGTRIEKCISYSLRQDHPHAYGDKLSTRGSDTQGEGSSPRVWGQVDKKFDDLSAKRIIPTRMGTRTSPFHIVDMYKDHPHAYGDKLL